jgi:uncharacterized protein (DUF2164 family)
MPIQLPKDTEQQLIASIQRFFVEHMDDEIGGLKASFLLDFCLREVGPRIYNQAIVDAQRHLQDRVADLEGLCFEPEFAYWKK